MFVDGKEIIQKEFAFDGCHKFYLLEGDEERVELEQCGYKIYPIEELPKLFWKSCPLRYIKTWRQSGVYVSQGEPIVTFTYSDKKVVVMDFVNDVCKPEVL